MAGPAFHNFQERHHELQLEPSIVVFDWVVHVFRYVNLDLGASSTGGPRLLQLLERLPRNANVGLRDDRMPLRLCCFGDNVTWHGTWNACYGIGEHTQIITGMTLAFNAKGPGWPPHSTWLTRVAGTHLWNGRDYATRRIEATLIEVKKFNHALHTWEGTQISNHIGASDCRISHPATCTSVELYEDWQILDL